MTWKDLAFNFLIQYAWPILVTILRPIRGRLLETLRKRVSVKPHEARVSTGRAYPVLLFILKMDSKAPVDFIVKSLVAHVYMSSTYIGTVRWSRAEEGQLREEMSATELSVVGELEPPHEVNDIKAYGEAYILLTFTPHIEVFKSKHSNKWGLVGSITLHHRVGDIRLPIGIQFTIVEEDLKRARSSIAEFLAEELI